jgi:hypothetical protein
VNAVGREDWPELPPGRLVVAFLCIVLPGEETKPAKAARSYIEDLRQHYPLSDPCVLVTEELQPIKRLDVADWIDYARKSLGDKFDYVTIFDAHMRLFPRGQESRPLYDVYQELFVLLHRAYRPARGEQPMFAEV